MPEACFGPLARSGAASRSLRSPLAPALALVIPQLLWFQGTVKLAREGAHLAVLDIGQIRPSRRPSKPCSFTAMCRYACMDTDSRASMIVGALCPSRSVPEHPGAGLLPPAWGGCQRRGLEANVRLAPVCVNKLVAQVILAVYYDRLVRGSPPHHAQQLQGVREQGFEGRREGRIWPMSRTAR